MKSSLTLAEAKAMFMVPGPFGVKLHKESLVFSISLTQKSERIFENAALVKETSVKVETATGRYSRVI